MFVSVTFLPRSLVRLALPYCLSLRFDELLPFFSDLSAKSSRWEDGKRFFFLFLVNDKVRIMSILNLGIGCASSI